MLQFPRVTQDYLISTIFPGLFNGLIIYYSLRQTFCAYFSIDDPYFWAFYFLFAIILTLMVGMSVEKLIFCILTCFWNKGMPEEYERDFHSWRIEICKHPDRSGGYDHAYIVGSIERLMYEYYCFNNITPAIIISVLTLGIYILFSPVLHKGICVIQWVFFIADLAFLSCVYFVMRKWLREFVELGKLLMKEGKRQIPE